ncbi:hypothetical protein [Paenibacillus sp. NAIST15-1]|uniref:hypothetical protein n=1 Tax=Paenibacillus sp. NAIST15-1 TaxID=1605994 RepID=UPI00086BA5C8|nr:hypothetical protein [Paenibacillus sp. NAIST15-1]GAV10336.1 hypothetical protein PBN151_0241 [Paenibacillus sp. NAIST15-1]
MESLDLKLKLLGGRPIYAKNFGDIYPLKIRDIIDVGYSEYMKYLNMIALDNSNLLKEAPEHMDTLELLLLGGGDEIVDLLLQSVSFFLRAEVYPDKENVGLIVTMTDGETRQINKMNYKEIQEIIKWQNYINHFDDKKGKEFDPADEETKNLKEQMDKLAKQRDELKRRKNRLDDEDNADLDFFDILAAITSKSYSINEINMLDLTVFQVYRKFKRLEIIDQYDISIQSMLAGAQNVQLRHWSSRDN